MKLKRYLKWMLGAATLLSGCADDDFIDRSQVWDGTIPDELTLTLTIPDPEIVSLGGTRGENGPISTVTLMQYDAKGQHLGNISFDELDIKPVLNSSNSEWTLTATLDKNSKSIQVVANYDVADTDTDPSKLETEKAYLLSYTDGEGAPYAGPVLWANVELKDLLADGSYAPQIALQRQAAKLSVEVKEDADFELTGFMVYGMAEKGCVAPDAEDFAAGNPTIPTDVIGSYNTKWIDPDKFGYFFETAAEAVDKNPHARIILKGIYEGKEYYYVAAFRTRTPEVKDEPTETPGAYSYEGIPALRNHWYTLSVEKVRGTGWKDLDDALTAMPDNRATIVLTDKTENITDMIATRDYMLGVSGDVTTPWNGDGVYSDDQSYFNVSIVTSYATTVDADALPVKFSTDTKWIKLSPDQKNGIENSEEPIKIGIDKNNLSTDDRTGEITVTLGKLTRTIKVTQKGRPLRRERKAEIYGLDGLADGTLYYKWIDGKLSEPAPQGMEESQNRGENRKDALIFAAVPAYELYYKIPVEPDDTYELSSDDNFTVKKDGGYYTIKAKTTDKPKPNIAKAVFTITNKDGAKIKYDLLQVGYFHKLDGQHQATAAGVKKGWFYYEVVHFKDGYGDGMYVLDRNLGASSNASYDPTSISYTAEDDAAIGGYFKVNTGRPEEEDRKGRYDHKTITAQIGMSYEGRGRFIVMSENELKNMGLPSGKNFGSGSISLSFDDGEVAGGNVYLPAAGYYYGTTYRNASHVNLWTRTLLGGTQGLTETDDEYGVNYRILDIFGGRVNYSGLRMGSGSGKTVKENLMRYLPLRLIWRGEGESMDASDVDDSSGTIGTGENITIWVKNSAGWNNMNLHAWSSKDNYMSSWPGSPMQKATHNGESNWYKLEIDKQWKSLIFNNGSDKTTDIDDYRNGHNDATEFEFEVKSSKTDGCNNYIFLGTGGGTPTPTERTAITIMLRNDANWSIDDTFSNSGIRFYDKDGKQVGSNLNFGADSKVTYENANWIKVELVNNSAAKSYITALNSGGTIKFFNGTYTSDGFSQISSFTSDGAFFFNNVGLNSGECKYISKQASATVNTTPGWSSSGDTPSEYMTIYFREWGGQVPKDVANGMYLQIDDNTTRKFMTKETINNVAYWKCTEVPVNTTKIKFCSYASGDSYSTLQYTGLQSDYKNYGSPLFYAMRGEAGQDWGVFRLDNPSGSGSTGGDNNLPPLDSSKSRFVIYAQTSVNQIIFEYNNYNSNNDPSPMTKLSATTSDGYAIFYRDIDPNNCAQFQLGVDGNYSGGWHSLKPNAGSTYYYTLSGTTLTSSSIKNAPRRAVRRK